MGGGALEFAVALLRFSISCLKLPNLKRSGTGARRALAWCAAKAMTALHPLDRMAKAPLPDHPTDSKATEKLLKRGGELKHGQTKAVTYLAAV